MSNWKEMLETRMAENGESWDDVEASALAEQDRALELNRGVGGVEGAPLTLWTKNHVYFPICYICDDGAAWVGSVSRNPGGKPTQHQGGG